MTSSTLLDLSTINSSMAPIFSLASLYTSTPISFDERHWPSRWTATFVSERSLAGVCAKAAPPNRAVVTRAAATDLKSILVSSCEPIQPPHRRKVPPYDGLAALMFERGAWHFSS